MIDSIDELIELVDNWEFMNGSQSNGNNDDNIIQSKNQPFDFGVFEQNSQMRIGKLPNGRNKKRSAANALPDEVIVEQTSGKKPRLFVELFCL